MVMFTELSDRLEAAPNCRKFLYVWQRWRGARLMSIKSDVRPEALGSAMPAITIFEVEAPDRIIFRMVSSDLEASTGRMRKGAKYVELARPEDREERIERHRRLVNTPCGAFSLVAIYPESGLTASLRSLALPLARDNEIKPRFLYVASDIESDKRWEPLPARFSSSLAVEYIYVDIGCGAPV